MNTTVQSTQEQQKPTIVVLTRVELGGAASIIAEILAGTHKKKQDYQKAVRQVTNIVKNMAPLHKVLLPQGSFLAVIEGGIYVEDEEVYYKFHFYVDPPEPIAAEL